MLSDRTLGPGEFIYPSLQKYLAAAALSAHYALTRLRGRTASLDGFVEWVTVLHPRLYYRTCRLVSVLTGVATVPLVFALGRRLTGDRRVGLAAALLLAVAYLHVRDAHFATVDVTMTFFTTLGLTLAVTAAQTSRTALLVAAGLAAGLAAATKYNAVLVWIAVPAAAWAMWRGASGPRAGAIVRAVALSAAAGGAGFLIGVPFAIREWARMLATIEGVKFALGQAVGPTGFEVHLLHSLPGGLGWPLYLAGLAGIAYAAWRRRAIDLVWLVFALAFFVFIGPIRWVVPRYVLPLVPLFVVAAASLVFAMLPRSRALAAAAIVVLAAPPLWRSVQYDRLAHRQDTRVVASDWVAAHLPAQSRIALCEGYGAPVLHGNRPGRMPFLPRPITCSRAEIAASRAAYLVTDEHPVLGWSAPAGHYRDVLKDGWRAVAVFDPFAEASAGPAYYFVGDAFYVPYTGLDTVTRGGPIVTVWERADRLAQ
jgi:hypothetical protein